MTAGVVASKVREKREKESNLVTQIFIVLCVEICFFWAGDTLY